MECGSAAGHEGNMYQGTIFKLRYSTTFLLPPASTTIPAMNKLTGIFSGES